jgi:hypothetical protein
MKHEHEKTAQKPVPQAAPNGAQDGVKEQRQKAEREEVVGRHRNDGQKDHKGAR